MSPRGKPNPETRLGPELVAALRGEPLPSDEYLNSRHDNLVGSIGAPGSDNFAELAWATRYVLAKPGRRDSIGSVCLEYALAQRKAFMGDELGRTYAGFHTSFHLAVAKASGGRGALGAAFDELLLHQLALRLYLTDPKGLQHWLGQRSAGFPPPNLRWELDLVGIGTGRQKGPKIRKGWGWVDKVLHDCAPALKRAGGPLQAGELPADILRRQGFRYLSPIYVRRSTGGLAVWMARNINGNTQPVLAIVSHQTGGTFFAPKDCDYAVEMPTSASGKSHGLSGKSRQPGAATVTLRDRELVYESALPEYGTLKLALPAGPVVELSVIGGPQGGLIDLRGEGLAVGVPPPPAGGEPSAPPPESSKPRKSWWLPWWPF